MVIKRRLKIEAPPGVFYKGRLCLFDPSRVETPEFSLVVQTNAMKNSLNVIHVGK